MSTNTQKISDKATSNSDSLDDFVESLNLGQKYGVLRIDWVLNNDIKGLEKGDDSWSNEKNWEISKYTEHRITEGTIKEFLEKDKSPISFLARYCKENKLAEESFFFPKYTDDFPQTIEKSLEEDFIWEKLDPNGNYTIPNETKNVIEQETEGIFPIKCEGTDLDRFCQYEEAYLKILTKASRKILGENFSIESIVIIPVITRSVSNISKDILGAYVIITSMTSSKVLKENSEFKRDLQALKYACKSQIDEKLSQRFFEIIKKASIKSAKAAIMSRNLSHNLGSHVMSYLKQNFSSAQEMMANGSLKDVDLPETEKTKEMPLLVGMGKFISYLQERQDYIATVSTDYIPYPSIVNFKDAIYDELNPDYRYQRHTEWQGHKPANILLQNIAKSEGLSREVIEKDGASVVQKENNILIKYGQFDGLNKDEAESDYNKLREWNFSLPGGSMGRQAIFSIVENVIRNAAKHGTRKSGDSLEIRFDIINPFVDTERMESDFKDYEGKVEDLYIVTLTDSNKTSEKDIEDINNVIEKSFVNEGTDLTASNKGIKEMIISAAWLRGIRIEEQNEEEEIAPILEARRTNEGCLQYVFCVPKVKEVAFIVAEDNSEWLEKRGDEVWIKNGWYVFTLEEYKKQSKNFNFVILDKALKSQKEEVRKISSSRFFVASEDKTNLYNQEIKFVQGIDQLNSENKLKEAEEELFKELAGIDCSFSSENNPEETKEESLKKPAKNDNSFKISIYDKKDEKEVTDEKGVTRVEAFEDEKSIRAKKYIYRKHNDTDKEFVDFLHRLKGDKSLTEALNGVEFAEGITGGNSTDRLLRHNKRDLLWIYQHAHAMKTKVAIFDERIFTRITGYEMSQLKEGESIVKEKIDWDKKLSGMSKEEKLNFVAEYDESRKKIASESGEVDQDTFISYDDNEIIDFAKKYYPEMDIAYNLKKVTPLVYNKKGIDVYTLTRMDETGKRFAIWGVRFELDNICTDTNNFKWKDNKYGVVEKVAELSFVDVKGPLQDGEQVNEKWSEPKITFFEKGNEVQEKHFDYDYLSIHQGLLDKVYEIKKNMTFGEKQRITKALHKCYVKNNCDDSVMDYIPGLTIHSGRSKPNKDDMPQHQPFIQYSAIENAVSDCKYTLVELLDFACYEQ